jgi:hypothetical protein
MRVSEDLLLFSNTLSAIKCDRYVLVRHVLVLVCIYVRIGKKSSSSVDEKKAECSLSFMVSLDGHLRKMFDNSVTF